MGSKSSNIRIGYRTIRPRFDESDVIAQSSGNQSEAARRLGVSRVTLIDKMKKYGLGSKR